MRFLLLALLFLSCEGSNVEPTTNEKVDNGKYDITITNQTSGEVTHIVSNKNMDSQWISEDLWIYLGTDEMVQSEPIGTITIQLSQIINAELATVSSALFSKSNQRKGTAMELVARTFNTVRIEDMEIKIGSNFISGEFKNWLLSRTLIPLGGQQEMAVVSGTFTAKAR
jgi:hypothetical protein